MERQSLCRELTQWWGRGGESTVPALGSLTWPLICLAHHRHSIQICWNQQWFFQPPASAWHFAHGQSLVTFSQIGHYRCISKQVTQTLQHSGSDHRGKFTNILQGTGLVSCIRTLRTMAGSVILGESSPMMAQASLTSQSQARTQGWQRRLGLLGEVRGRQISDPQILPTKILV